MNPELSSICKLNTSGFVGEVLLGSLLGVEILLDFVIPVETLPVLGVAACSELAGEMGSFLGEIFIFFSAIFLCSSSSSCRFFIWASLELVFTELVLGDGSFLGLVSEATAWELLLEGERESTRA